MAIEPKGPGGVGNSYGRRTTNQPTRIASNKPKNIYEEYSNSADTLTPAATASLQSQFDSTDNRFNVVVTQSFVTSANPTAIRIRPQEKIRNYSIIRNKSNFIGQVGYTDFTNFFVTQPTTFINIPPGKEDFILGGNSQIWVRPKTNGESVEFEIEVSIKAGAQ